MSETARALGDPTALNGRSSSGSVDSSGGPGFREQLRDELLRPVAGSVREATLLVVDPTDGTRLYARTMERLAKVRDGSEKGGEGDWCMRVVAAERSSARVVSRCQERSLRER